jgi:hypothetical protein
VEQCKDDIARPGVKIAGGFICQQQLWFHDQCPGQGSPLLFAAGEFADFMIEPVIEVLPFAEDWLQPLSFPLFSYRQ